MLNVLRRIALGAVILVALAVAAGVALEQWSGRSAARILPVGEMIEFDGRRSHLHCVGEGSPTVILEAGLDAWGSQGWVTVQPEIARLTRVCSYDRAGILWSQPRKGPRDAHRIAGELQALLESSSESPPYVMVGHSLGGVLSRVFADRFEGEVVGFVFVDASHPQQMERLPSEAVELMSAGPPRFLIQALAAIGFFRLMEIGPPNMPEETRDIAGALFPKSISSVLDEIASLEEIAGQAGQTRTLGDRPVVILTADPDEQPHGIDLSDDVYASVRETWLVLQAELAALSSDADHRIIPDATHYIHWDNPGAVIAAIQDVVNAVRGGVRVGPGPDAL